LLDNPLIPELRSIYTGTIPQQRLDYTVTKTIKQQPKTPAVVQFDRNDPLFLAIEQFAEHDGRPSITNAVHALCRDHLKTLGLLPHTTVSTPASVR